MEKGKGQLRLRKKGQVNGAGKKGLTALPFFLLFLSLSPFP
jgi:hypothetical protein